MYDLNGCVTIVFVISQEESVLDADKLKGSTLHAVNGSHKEAQRDEGARRQHEHQHVVGLGKQDKAKDAARSEQLAANAKKSEAKGETKANADAVHQALNGTILGCKGFGATEDDAVHDDQRNEQSQSGIDARDVCLHDHLKNGDERRDDNDEDRNSHHVGRQLLDKRDDNVRADEDEHGCQTHRQAVDSTRRGGQRRAHAKHQYKGGILFDDAVFDDTYVVHTSIFLSLNV